MRSFLTEQQLARRWHLGDQTLPRWREDRRGPPFVRIGQQVLYPEQGVLSYEHINLAWLRT
jgi:hypothetical protein